MDRATANRSASRLLSDQQVGVLCTAADGQPYGFPMVFVVGADLRSIAFATFRNTRKYQVLTQNPQVAFVVDNRPKGEFEPASTEVAVATGSVAEVTERTERQRLRVQLGNRYPKFQAFFSSERTALFKLAVTGLTYGTGLEETVALPQQRDQSVA